MARSLALGAIFISLAACASRPAERRAVFAPRHREEAAGALRLLPAWSDRASVVALPDGAAGILFGGARAQWSPSSDAVTAATAATPAALVEARPLARGVVFRDAAQRLWRADDFLGELTPLGEGPAEIVSPAGGEGPLALRRGGVIALTDGRELITPEGLGEGRPFAVFFCDGRRGFALAADGLLDASADGGRTWSPAADAGPPCAVPAAATPTVSDAVIERARETALRAAPELLEARGAVRLADGRAVVGGAGGGWRVRAEGGESATLDAATDCEVAPWGPCAAVLCGEGTPTLRRVCADAPPEPVAHDCRGAFVFSDDGRHALCARPSREPRLIDATAGSTAPTALPFAALARSALHGATALAVVDGALLSFAGESAPTREPLEVPLDAVVSLGDRGRLGHAGDRLFWQAHPGGPWRRLEAVAPQAFGGPGSRFLARGDLSPAPPTFACDGRSCRFGSVLVTRPAELVTAPTGSPREAAGGASESAPALPTLVDPTTLAGCGASAPLTRRRPLAGISLDGVVHAALEVRGATATLRWITAEGARAASLATSSLPGALSPGDDPEVLFPQGTPAAVGATSETLFLATGDGAVGASLWAIAAGSPPRATALPEALDPALGETLWEGAAVGEEIVVMQSAVVDEVALAHVWIVSTGGALTAHFPLRARELPQIARVGGAPGVVTLNARDGAIDLAFRGATVGWRWRVTAPATLPACRAPNPNADWTDAAVDVRHDREGARVGSADRAVFRVTRARVRLDPSALCVERLRGASGAPAPNGRGLLAADIFLDASGPTWVGTEHDGARATPLRCASR